LSFNLPSTGLGSPVSVVLYSNITLTSVVIASFAKFTFDPVKENILPNSQWQIITGLGNVTRMNHQGTGTVPQVPVSSYSTGSNTVTCNTSDTVNTQLATGDIVTFTTSAEANMTICAIEVDTIVTNTSFTGKLPRGRISTVSATCAANILTIGDLTGNNGNGPDGWNKTVALLLWRDATTQNNKAGSRYQLGLQKTIAGLQILYHNVPALELDKYKGKKVVFGIWGKHKIKGGTGTWRVSIDDGQSSFSYSNSASQTDYQWLEVSKAISSSAGYVTFAVELLGNSSDVYYVNQPMGGFGAYIGENGYSQPENEILIPTIKSNPIPYVGASFTFSTVADATGTTYGWNINFYAETQGKITPTIKAIGLQIEGINAVAGQALAVRNWESNVGGANIIYAIVAYSQVTGVMVTGAALVILYPPNGRAFLYSGTAGSSWSAMSIDINYFVLS